MQAIGAALLVLVVAAMGCNDAADSAVDNHSPDLGLPKVPCPRSTPEFVATPSAGLEAIGRDSSLVTAKLIDADYSPPRIYRNDWTILFSDADGEPLDDIAITKAEPYMPVHGHDGGFPPKIMKLKEPGVVFFQDINLKMGGPWEVRFWVDSEQAGGADYIVFDVCVNDD